MSVMSVSAAVLAGGKAERMSGRDKGLLLFRGEPMARSVGNALQLVSHCVFINANQHRQDYLSLGFEVVADDEEHRGKGPLSGLISCLAYANTSHLLISPCDTPCISSAAFEQLKAAAQASPGNIYYLRSASGVHPLHAILPVTAALTALRSFLKSQNRLSVMAFYEVFGSFAIDWRNEHEMNNINTLKELND
ncbi:molybdenum cofactor guanylyltransferase [Marinomonas sp. IMCC 4694]|uniref:molybdenum cofactor guanylyltransferase n=1 Tax=Marinomonas sp. IMCC 4694 TaxID=2605432 RepID=UPI0011E88AF1|nr:molybdenum cofactor guanylyltransferase [Marinomonas sp. IMCC 4694]TYL48169.1 molybdenum cofactor guanylyltransferase [Marinomonas sp. IMCC 4694]